MSFLLLQASDRRGREEGPRSKKSFSPQGVGSVMRVTGPFLVCFGASVKEQVQQSLENGRRRGRLELRSADTRDCSRECTCACVVAASFASFFFYPP